jgi:hypothetical protein
MQADPNVPQPSPDPYSRFDEGVLACETLKTLLREKFLQERDDAERARYLDRALTLLTLDERARLTIDLNDPEHSGGKWLNVVRAAREAIRRAAVKAARKAKKPKK